MTLTANGYLAETFASIRAAVANLDTAQLNFKPTPDSWSIREILEHMVMAEDMTLGPIQQQLASTAPSPEPAPATEVDGFILAAFPDRTYRVSAPPFLVPSGSIAFEQLMQRLEANQRQMENLLANEAWLRTRRIEAQPIVAASQGKYTSMDGVQWLLVTAAHNARHTSQILEVRRSAQFPG